MCVCVTWSGVWSGQDCSRLLRMRDDGVCVEAGVRLRRGDGRLVFESLQFILRVTAAVSSLHQVRLCRISVCFHAF